MIAPTDRVESALANAQNAWRYGKLDAAGILLFAILALTGYITDVMPPAQPP